MKITHVELTRLTIPMEPFVIATETCNEAGNLLVRIHTDAGISGIGECSPFPMLVGETQDTCFHVGQNLARKLIGTDPLQIQERLRELDGFIAFNATIKSAFDMALFDIAAKEKGVPLYSFLGGRKRIIQTDLTIGISSAESMAQKAISFVADGVKIIKIKLGKDAQTDIDRIRLIREAVGPEIILRADANQGWNYEEAVMVLNAIAPYHIQFCEQPMHHKYDSLLPALKKQVKVPIMADESMFNHYDAERLILADSCSFVNIKLAKSGGIAEAIRIADTAASHQIPCMLGGMVESRLALTAKVHLAMSHDNIQFYDLDTCLLGHLADPVTGGARYNNYFLELEDTPGIGADIDPDYIKNAETVTI